MFKVLCVIMLYLLVNERSVEQRTSVSELVKKYENRAKSSDKSDQMVLPSVATPSSSNPQDRSSETLPFEPAGNNQSHLNVAAFVSKSLLLGTSTPMTSTRFYSASSLLVDSMESFDMRDQPGSEKNI